VPVHVIDTAGLRESLDEVEKIGVARSWSEIERADAVLLMHDLTRVGEPAYDAGEAQIEARLPPVLLNGDRLLHVFNKSDAAAAEAHAPKGLALSARTGAGIDALRARLLELAGWHAQPEGLFIARTRHVQALRETRAHLTAALAQAARADAALDLLAEELRLAHDALGEITGAFSSDELLGEIFSRFCIGK
ncbi:MAG: tRNA uridine-5-carboxymethylaminomethyl(34) synthesis GTPase MnmE, partial [Burkholderiales bacterium]